MQPTENFNVARRTLDVEDYIDILRRHKSWVFGPFLLTLVVSVVGVYLWPDSYESQSLVKVVPQQVPQNMVPAANTDLTDRINSMAATVLSRNVLINIINNFDLYASERKRRPMEDVVENIMKPSIKITPQMMATGGRSVPAFRVQFSYENRNLANKVVADVTSRFITENKSSRSTRTTEQTQFLKDSAEQAKKNLASLEERISQFRIQNNGRLPDQTEQNYRQLNTYQTNYQYLTNAKQRAEMEKLGLETNLRVEKSRRTELTREAPQTAATIAAMKSEKMQEIERSIQGLEISLQLALQKYTAVHPEVINIQNQLAVAKDRKQQIQKEESETKTVAAAAPPANRQLQMQVLDMDGMIMRLETASRQTDLEIADLESQIKKVQGQIDKLQGQISAAPLGEQQYGDLLRERDIAKAKYIELDATLSKAQLSQDLEDRGQGENLELLEAATLPVDPTSPKRPQVIGIGAGLGLLLGIVIAAAREMKDTSLKNLKDVRAYTQMAILGSVPLLENDFVVRRRRRMAWLGWTTACLMSAVTMAGSVVYYYASSR